MRNGALKNLRERKRKGFTLVELLIVIIIIGILAGAMLMVAGSGTDKAEATKIVSDLRSLKSAALMAYSDSTPPKWPTTLISLDQYMDRKVSNQKAADGTSNRFAFDQNGRYLGYNLTGSSATIKEKLKGMAKESGLIEGTASSVSSTDPLPEYSNGDGVWMKIY